MKDQEHNQNQEQNGQHYFGVPDIYLCNCGSHLEGDCAECNRAEYRRAFFKWIPGETIWVIVAVSLPVLVIVALMILDKFGQL